MWNLLLLTLSPRAECFLYLLSISSNFFLKLGMGTSVIEANLLIMKLDFVFIRFVILNLTLT